MILKANRQTTYTGRRGVIFDRNAGYKIHRANRSCFELCADQFESSTSPPRATPRAFDLLKIALFKFPPLGARKPFKCPTN